MVTTPSSICSISMIGFAPVPLLSASEYKLMIYQLLQYLTFFSLYRHSINSLSFSHDGEYLAIANAGSYIDIVSDLSCK